MNVNRARDDISNHVETRSEQSLAQVVILPVTLSQGDSMDQILNYGGTLVVLIAPNEDIHGVFSTSFCEVVKPPSRVVCSIICRARL